MLRRNPVNSKKLSSKRTTMRIIPIKYKNTTKRVIVDDDVFESIKAFNITFHNKGYASVYFTCASTGKKHHILLHRLITGANEGESVDHKSGYGLDNRRRNLRVCNASQNMSNRSKLANWKHSKYKGVTKLRGKWASGIKVPSPMGFGPGKQKHLGLFSSEIEAHEAYIKAAIELQGKFARCGTREESFVPMH